MDVYFCPLLQDTCGFHTTMTIFVSEPVRSQVLSLAIVAPSGLSPNLTPSADCVQERLGGEEREAEDQTKPSKKFGSKRGWKNGVEVGRQYDDILPLQ